MQKLSMMKINPELLSAIERNQKWIERKCKISEKCVAKYAELVQEVHYNLLSSDKNFSNKVEINADAWVKRITTNVTAVHIKQELFEKKIFRENTENIEVVHDAKVEMVFDLQVAINYIKTKMNERDREIMFLYLMQEPYASIAEIIGLEVATITNQVSMLKKELNNYLNKGLV